MIDDEKFLDVYVMLCNAVSKPDRLRIIKFIGNKKCNVGNIQKHLDISMSSLSNHLNDLYKVGILGKEKKGNYVYYYLTEKKIVRNISEMQQTMKSLFFKRDK